MSDISTKSQELAKQLWAIANDLRGSMDSSKFKNYILGTIFYRYLSERTEKYMDEILKNDGVTYREALENDELAEAVKEMTLDHLGYIIEPDNLFNSLVDKIKEGSFSIEDYEKAISSLVGSTIGQESEAAFDKLFDDMNLQDKDLGKEVSQRTKLIGKVISKVYDIDFDAIKKINVPSVIYGPIGKEYHKWSERVNKKSLLHTVPRVTRELIKQAWNFE